MNKRILVLFFIILSQLSYAQITTTSIAKEKKDISKAGYDSLTNFLGKDVYKYVGQDFYLNETRVNLRKNGYKDFIIDYNFSPYEKENIYKCCEPEAYGYASKYNELAGKYFHVTAFYEHPKAKESQFLYGSVYYLELVEKESRDTLYYEYKSDCESFFPFIVVGFYEKLKAMVVGQKFVLTNKCTKFSKDIYTGEKFTATTNERLICTDITIAEDYYDVCLIVKNSLGQSAILRYDYVFGELSKARTYFEYEAIEYEKKFGKQDWMTILTNKVQIGFTEEMVLLAFGKPNKINYSSTGDQWVYDDNYLYFLNGKLTSFN